MSAVPLAILATGMVSAVGLSAPATCAAVRAKLSNPSPTRFLDASGEWIVAQQVALDKPWRGISKLAKMAAMGIEEALEGIPRTQWPGIPLLLCVAETDRPGRTAGLDDQLFLRIQDELGARFAAQSAIVAHGRVGVAVALAQARSLIAKGTCERVLVAAADSFLSWPTVEHYAREDRLLTSTNSNGFMPGEGAGALLVGRPGHATAGELLCTGIGFARERAFLDSGEPLRGDGLTQAIQGALADADCEMALMDFRISDISGEQYYFKEAALALARTLRKVKEEFDLWHPAESTGEQGAVAGAAVIALADAACRKAYAMGHNILAHMANDSGQRAALTLRFTGHGP